MPNCKLCGHSAIEHCWQRLGYRECWLCRCPGYLPNNYLPLVRHKPPYRINNSYIRRLRRRR